MHYRSLALVAALAFGCALNVSADDKDAKPVKEKEVKKTEVKVEKRDERGSGFKRFWIHTVGGSIGNGLKSGARKISNAFD